MTVNAWRPVVVADGNRPPDEEYRCPSCRPPRQRTPYLFVRGYIAPGSVLHFHCPKCNGTWTVRER